MAGSQYFPRPATLFGHKVIRRRRRIFLAGRTLPHVRNIVDPHLLQDPPNPPPIPKSKGRVLYHVSRLENICLRQFSDQKFPIPLTFEPLEVHVFQKRQLLLSPVETVVCFYYAIDVPEPGDDLLRQECAAPEIGLEEAVAHEWRFVQWLKVLQDHVEDLSRQSVESVCKCPTAEILREDMVRMQQRQLTKYESCHTWNLRWVCLKVLVKLDGESERAAFRCSHVVEYIIPQDKKLATHPIRPSQSSTHAILPSTLAYTKRHHSSCEDARSKSLRVRGRSSRDLCS